MRRTSSPARASGSRSAAVPWPRSWSSRRSTRREDGPTRLTGTYAAWRSSSMSTPESLRYAATHEWARKDDDGTVVVGITDFAQDQLGDVVFVELPERSEEHTSELQSRENL